MLTVAETSYWLSPPVRPDLILNGMNRILACAIALSLLAARSASAQTDWVDVCPMLSTADVQPLVGAATPEPMNKDIVKLAVYKNVRGGCTWKKIDAPGRAPSATLTITLGPSRTDPAADAQRVRAVAAMRPGETVRDESNLGDNAQSVLDTKGTQYQPPGAEVYANGARYSTHVQYFGPGLGTDQSLALLRVVTKKIMSAVKP